MRFSFLAALGLAVLWTVVGDLSRAAAQGLPMADADQKAIMEYKLTLEKLDKINAINRKIIETAKADAQFGKEVQALNNDKGGTYDQVDAIFGKQAPRVLAIIKGEGLDARDYMLGMLTAMFARMGAEMRADGDPKLPDFIPAANADMAEKNKAKFDEVNRLLNDLSAIGKTSEP